MNHKKVIGILGGMGPVASAETYMQIVRICQRKYKAVEDHDFPEIFVYSLPLQGFDSIGFQSQDRALILEQLIVALKKLEASGVDLIIIDCNTVHYFYDDLQARVSPKILNLIQITTDYVAREGIETVGILCSNTSRRVGLYEERLEKAGIRHLRTTDEEQRVLDQAILAVMADKVSYEEHDGVSLIVDRLFHAGADAIILGCTELSYLLKERVDTSRYIDSQSLAIAQAVAEWHASSL